MRFLQYLKEMSLDQALKVMSLTYDNLGDQDLIKKKYKELALQNHPDRGGSTEAMKNINVAFDILKKSKAVETGPENKGNIFRAAFDEKLRSIVVAVKTALISGFDPGVFIQYFSQFTDKVLEHKFIRIYPEDKHMKTAKVPSEVELQSEFFSSDRNTVFQFDVTAYSLYDLIRSGKLGSGDLSFNLYVNAYVFHENKKHKLGKSDWKFTNDHSFFRQPEKIFPKAKLSKIFTAGGTSRVFSRRDMYAFLQKKLNAKTDYKDQAEIPLGGDYKLLIFRYVFFKSATWSVTGIYKKYSKIDKSMVVSIPETEAGAMFLADLQKYVMKAGDNEQAIIKRTNEFLRKLKDNKESTLKMYV